MPSLMNDALEWEFTNHTARKAVLQPKPMCVSEPRLGLRQFAPTARSSQQSAISGSASTATTANRTEEPRHMLSALIYVISVALVAATTIVGLVSPRSLSSMHQVRFSSRSTVRPRTRSTLRRAPQAHGSIMMTRTRPP